MEQAKKITILSSFFPPNVVGGSEVTAKLLADYLHSQNWDVEVLTGAAVLPNTPYRTVSVPALRSRPSLVLENLWARRTAKRIKELIDPDRIVHSFDLLSRAVAAELAFPKSVTTIQDISVRCGDISGVLIDGSLCPGCNLKNVGLHSTTRFKHRGLGRLVRMARYLNALPYRRRILGKFNQITVVSKFLKEYLSLENSTVIPNMVDSLRPACRIDSLDAPTVVVIGRLAFDKGTDLVIETLAKLPEFLAVFVGDGNHEKWQKYAKSKGVAERVRIIGRVPTREVANWYHAGDLVVNASRCPEAFGLTLLEAMTLGKAVVGPNFGGPAELIVEGSTGRLFKRGDPIDLARAIKQAYEERSSLGQRGKLESQRYQQEVIGPKYLTIYDQLP